MPSVEWEISPFAIPVQYPVHCTQHIIGSVTVPASIFSCPPACCPHFPSPRLHIPLLDCQKFKSDTSEGSRTQVSESWVCRPSAGLFKRELRISSSIHLSSDGMWPCWVLNMAIISSLHHYSCPILPVHALLVWTKHTCTRSKMWNKSVLVVDLWHYTLTNLKEVCSFTARTSLHLSCWWLVFGLFSFFFGGLVFQLRCWFWSSYFFPWTCTRCSWNCIW